MSRAPLLAMGALLGFVMLVAGALGWSPWRHEPVAPTPAVDAFSPELVLPAVPKDSVTVDADQAPPDTAEAPSPAPDEPLEQPDSLSRPFAASDSI
ncbi:hypothetical protein JXA88_09760 [Candidatus Fermentibacteria bacterium]|nr:hypothetical protein [Candidatus Fermentibacteria bacterium]